VNNVAYKVTGNKLVIEVDLSAQAVAAAEPSKTGKTLLLATSGGATTLPQVSGRGCSFSLNVMLNR
jgi:hypothetical protein